MLLHPVLSAVRLSLACNAWEVFSFSRRQLPPYCPDCGALSNSRLNLSVRITSKIGTPPWV